MRSSDVEQMKVLLLFVVTVLAFVSGCSSSVDETISSRSLASEVASSQGVDVLADDDDEPSIEAEERLTGVGPQLVFGRRISVDELSEMLSEKAGRAQVIKAIVDTSTSTESEAECVLSNLSYETFLVVANVEQPNASQRAEFLSALDLCDLVVS